MIDKQSPLPIYFQLEHMLRQQLTDSRLQPGDALPSEREYAGQFQISRMTVRQAISNLVNEGLLVRQKGRGTFVAPKRVAKPGNLASFTEDMQARGLHPASRLLVFELVPASLKVADRLQIAEHAPVYQIARVRLADGEPMALETVYLSANLAKGLTEAAAAASLYCYLEEKLHITIGRSVQSVAAISATEREQRYLLVAKGAPVLQISRTTYLQNGQPLEYVKSFYRADRYQFTAEATR